MAGALAGRVVGGAFDLHNPSLLTIVGVAAFLGVGYRVPLAAITFVAEATGRPGFVVPGLLAAVVADLMMGRASVTAYQRTQTPDQPIGDPPIRGDGHTPDTTTVHASTLTQEGVT